MPLDAVTRDPQAALAYWRGKAAVTRDQFDALTDQARARAFTVAGLTRQDQVGAIYSALAQALEQGEPLAQFKRRLRPLLERQGWLGKRAWRVENIYRTNLQAAYQAGRYAQMKQVARRRPYWRYLAVMDRRTRPTHRALHGKVYRHDHPFWGEWYPPNGFACRCTVQTLSHRQMEARGLQAETHVPRLVEPIDPDTGAKLPALPLTPDPGWAGNVGRDWLAGLAPSEVDGPLEDLLSAAVCRDGKGLFASGDICKPPLRTLDPRHILTIRADDIMPKGLPPEDYVRAFLREFGIADLHGSTVHTLPGGIPVVITQQLFRDKSHNRWKVLKNGREQYVRLLARTIQDPYEVWMVPAIVAKRNTTVLRLLRVFSDTRDRIGGFAVFNLVGGRRWSGATAFTPGMERRSASARTRVMLRYLEQQRVGTLIYREP